MDKQFNNNNNLKTTNEDDNQEDIELEIDLPSEQFEIDLDFDDDNQFNNSNSSEQMEKKYQEQENNQFDEFYYYNQYFSIYMNKCCRSEMQDRFSIIPKFDAEEKIAYLAVFDGHGSSKIAEFLANNLHDYIINSEYFSTDIPKAITYGFNKIDKYVQQCSILNPEENGSVVLCGIIHNNQLYLANLGDSKAVLIKNNDKIEELTNEQTPSRPDEQKRIEDLGGYVIQRGNSVRLQGQIDVSRSIGDKKYKPYIIAEPEISIYNLSYEDKYLIIATDGLWNNSSSQNIVKYSKLSNDINDLPKVIFQQSQKEQIIKDNTTILCLDVKLYLDQLQDMDYVSNNINNNTNQQMNQQNQQQQNNNNIKEENEENTQILNNNNKKIQQHVFNLDDQQHQQKQCIQEI